MDRKTKWRSFWLALLAVIAVLTLLPSLVPSKKLPRWYKNFFDSEVRLGLDLQGGLHIVYSIDLDKAVDDLAVQAKRDIEASLSELKLKGRATTPRTPRGAVSLVLENSADLDKLPGDLLSAFDEQLVTRECTENADRSRCYRVSSDYAQVIRESALEQALRTVRERIDNTGVAEPTVIRKGNDIIVELPGLKSEKNAATRTLIERTAKLEFKIVAENEQFMRDIYSRVSAGDDAATKLQITTNNETWVHDDSQRRFNDYYLEAPQNRKELFTIAQAKERDCFDEKLLATDGKVECKVEGRELLGRYLGELAAEDPKFALDDDHQFGFELVIPDKAAGVDRKPYWRTYYLNRAVELGGDGVAKASVVTNPTTNRPEVIIDFTRWGGRRFGELTGAAVGRKMAIILDDRVNSAPTIQTRIDGGSSSITMGGGTRQHQQAEAEDLVNVLRTGSLPAPLKEESSAEVGPLLGQDAIDKAKVAFGLGSLLVIFIMVGYYRTSGFISIIALTLNITFMMALLAGFGATLTLPGIAALVLTVGMAVDANIIIYERIREELRAGKSVRGAVDAGFSHGFSAILDGNLTTAVAAYVLYQFGSGPIRGFAVMLLIGIVCTLFTATWCTRLFFEYYIGKSDKPKPLAI